MAAQAPESETAHLLADAGNPEVLPLLENDLAPVTAIGGLLSVKAQWRFYAPLLGGAESDLSAKERFSAIPDRGLGDFDDMYARLEDRFLSTQERLGEPTVVVAHSLGTIFATELGVDHPDEIAAVICLAGLPSGIKGETPGATLLRQALGDPEGAELLQTGSDFMIDHTEKIASEWSPDVPVHLLAATTDVLVPARHSLALELPDSQQAEKRMVAPHGVPSWVMRRVFGMPPDAEPLRSVLPADHVSIAITPSIISYTRNVRREAAGYAVEAGEILPPISPEPLAVTAVAA